MQHTEQLETDNGPDETGNEAERTLSGSGRSEDDKTGADTNTNTSLTRTSTREVIVQTKNEPVSSVQPVPGRTKRPWTQYRRIIFVLGCIMGVVLAWIFRPPDLQLDGLLDVVDLAEFLDDLKSALPSAIPIGLVKEATEIQQHTRETITTGAFSIGEQMAREGMTAHHPLVMVYLPPFLSVF
jgi:hypothetical protein